MQSEINCEPISCATGILEAETLFKQPAQDRCVFLPLNKDISLSFSLHVSF